MYHWEADHDHFLVLSVEALLIYDSEQRSLRHRDFVHCPTFTEHIILGAGDAPCAVLAIGAREYQDTAEWGAYTVEDAAIRHGAGVEQETADAEEAYARVPTREPTRYREGWLPGS
jgi:uncharacterized cupin superfamily protein